MEHGVWSLYFIIFWMIELWVWSHVLSDNSNILKLTRRRWEPLAPGPETQPNFRHSTDISQILLAADGASYLIGHWLYILIDWSLMLSVNDWSLMLSVHWLVTDTICGLISHGCSQWMIGHWCCQWIYWSLRLPTPRSITHIFLMIRFPCHKGNVRN